MLALDELCQRVHDNIQEAMASEKQIQERLNTKRKRHFSENSPNGWPTSQNIRKYGFKRKTEVFSIMTSAIVQKEGMYHT